MPETENQIVLRLLAMVRALRPSDWVGDAGRRFRDGIRALSKFASQKHLQPRDVLDQGIVLGQRKIEGLASVEHAAAIRSYAEAEEIKIDTRTKELTLTAKVRQEIASAQKLEAEASLAKIREADALLDLMKKLKECGVELKVEKKGDLFVSLAALHDKFSDIDSTATKDLPQENDTTF